jgi:hypothetical protein
MFHALARDCADLMVGGKSSDRSKHAWRQVYRALEHGTAKNACQNNGILSKFPKDVEDFANQFVAMQIKRHQADYDPVEKFTKSGVLTDIETARIVIEGFAKVAVKDRRAFAAHVLFKQRA